MNRRARAARAASGSSPARATGDRLGRAALPRARRPTTHQPRRHAQRTRQLGGHCCGRTAEATSATPPARPDAAVQSSDSGASGDGPAGPAEDGAGCKLRFGLEEPVRLSGVHCPLQSNHAQDSEPGGVSGELEAATRPEEKVENIKAIVPKKRSTERRDKMSLSHPVFGTRPTHHRGKNGALQQSPE